MHSQRNANIRQTEAFSDRIQNGRINNKVQLQTARGYTTTFCLGLAEQLWEPVP